MTSPQTADRWTRRLKGLDSLTAVRLNRTGKTNFDLEVTVIGVATVVTGAYIWSAFEAVHTLGHPTALVPFVASLAFLVVGAAKRRSQPRLAVMGLLIALAAGVAASLQLHHGTEVSIALAVAIVGSGLPTPAMAATTGIVSAAACAVSPLWDPDVNSWLAAIFAIAVLLNVRTLFSAGREEELSSQLKVAKRVRVDDAIVAERAYLARELHDIVAHTLSGLAIHLESTRSLAAQEHVSEALADRLDAAVGMTRGGLHEARSVVAALRDDRALSVPERLPQLVYDFGTAAGITTSLDVRGSTVALTPEVAIAVIRTTQEAMTNAARHGQATRIEVNLWYEKSLLSLEIRDNGQSAAVRRDRGGVEDGGNGLRGMRERAELAGGTLDAGRDPAGGWRVVLNLPLDALVATGV